MHECVWFAGMSIRYVFQLQCLQFEPASGLLLAQMALVFPKVVTRGYMSPSRIICKYVRIKRVN